MWFTCDKLTETNCELTEPDLNYGVRRNPVRVQLLSQREHLFELTKLTKCSSNTHKLLFADRRVGQNTFKLVDFKVQSYRTTQRCERLKTQPVIKCLFNLSIYIFNYSWIDYRMGMKHNVSNWVSADCQSYSVFNSSIIIRPTTNTISGGKDY